jgi:hypothetical protein
MEVPPQEADELNRWRQSTVSSVSTKEMADRAAGEKAVGEAGATN